MMPQRLSSRADTRRPIVSLTPLIDVVFILLVFFMLASSYLDWRTIDLGAPVTVGARGAGSGAVLVEIRPEGLRLSGEPVDLEELAVRVGALAASDGSRKVLVKPARGVPLQDAVRVIDRLKLTGVSELSFVSVPSQ